MAREISAMVVSRVLSLRSTPIMPSGGVYADQIKFDFDAEWDGYTKKAVFKRSESAIYPMYLDAENTCHIPPEAIKTDGTLQIGVVGTKDDDTYGTSTLTSTYAKYQIVDGACMEIAVEDPTPTVYEEIMELLTTLEGKITALEGAVRYDAAQALTDAQQAQARSNIGDDDPNAMLSFCVFDKSMWGKGIATEAARIFVSDIKVKFDLQTLGAFTFSNNYASIKVLLNNGFQEKETFTENGIESKYLQIAF